MGNMTRRKPWGLDETYGESVKQALFSLVKGVEVVWFWGLSELLALAFAGRVSDSPCAWNIVNPASDKPVLARNALLFRVWPLDGDVRLVMRRPLGVVHGIAGSPRVGRFR